MKFKIFAVFLLLIVCFTFVVPFVCAETVTEGGSQFIFRELHGSYVESLGTYTNYIDTDNDYFSVSYWNSTSINNFLFYNLPNVSYEFSMNGSPSAYFSGNYALFTPNSPFGNHKMDFSPYSDIFYDGLLHSFALLFGVPHDFPYDVQDNYISFTNVDFWDDSSLTKLTTTIGEPVADLVPLQVSGSSRSTSLSAAPSFSFFLQDFVDSETASSFAMMDIYCLTWYHTPTFYNMSFNVFPTGASDLFIFFSLIDMVSVNTGYETGYREGIQVGKEQANNTVNTGSASYRAGYDIGYEEGYDSGFNDGYRIATDYANTHVNETSASYHAGYDIGYQEGEYFANTNLNEGSVSYIQGFADGEEFANTFVNSTSASYSAGYSEGLYYANTHVNESSASYVQGKYDGIESANEYTFLGLISAIIDAPIRAVFGYTTVANGFEVQHPGLLSFEVFGVDMSNFVLSIFSIAVVLCIIRVIRGG